MPEGDTVWHTAATLRRHLAGRTLTRCDIRVPRFAAVDLTGEVVDEVISRGKHLFIRTGTASIHSHLQMDGSWRVGNRPVRVDHRARIILEANQQEQAIRVVGVDLGLLEVIDRHNDGAVVAHLGPDLLADDWDPQRAAANLIVAPDRPIAEALLDQRVLAGIGNVALQRTVLRQRSIADGPGERGRRPAPPGHPRPRHAVGQPLPLESVHHWRYPGRPATVGLRAGRAGLPPLRHAHRLRHYRRAGAVLVPGLPALNRAIKAST